MAEITVIVPVYRAEHYLPDCIDSILNQSFSDFRLILVDDGSPDRCGEICEDYAKKDGRITVLHQTNQGQAAARNHALERTDSPWICFVDSDDLIHPRTLELLHRAVEKGNAAVSMCRMLEAPRLPEDFFGPRDGEFQLYFLDDETLARMYDQGDYPAWVSCGKLIRRDLFERHLFCPGRVYEDNEAVCHWTAGQRLARIDEDLYFYRTNPESTTKSAFSMKRLDFLWALENLVKFYGNLGYEETRARFLDRYVRETAGFCRVARYELGRLDLVKKLRGDLRRCLQEEGLTLTKAQREDLLDATHPKLIRLYWPMEAMLRILKQEGLKGIFHKLIRHLGKEENI